MFFFIFPGHYMSWSDDKIALGWLEKCGLQIRTFKSIFINPDVDMFADNLEPDYHDLYVLCFKS